MMNGDGCDIGEFRVIILFMMDAIASLSWVGRMLIGPSLSRVNRAHVGPIFPMVVMVGLCMISFIS